MSDDDFHAWLKGQIGKDHRQIIADGRTTIAEAGGGSGGDLAARIQQFIFYLQSGRKPVDVSESDWQAYRPVYKALVKERQRLTKDVLDLFA
ncbi:MAG: hypothetical protein V3U48_08055 [Rhodospirillales bacterium]